MKPPALSPRPFAEVDEQHSLTRHGAFDADFDTAIVLEGDLAFPKNATGADVLKAFGLKKAPEGSCLFVVTGNLTVAGGLDLDAGISFSLGLAVLGDLEAKAVRVDATMLFVFGDARVEQAIFFETNDGTLCVAKRTVCPLVVCHDGDLNLAASGDVLDSSDEGPFAGGEAAGSSGEGWPTSSVTMTLEEAKEKLVAAVFEDDEFESDKAYKRAAKGQSLFRPVKASAASAPAPTPGGLTPVPVTEATNVTSLVSDGKNLWMGAAAMLMFDGKRFTRVWRSDPEGSADEPPGTPAGLEFALAGSTLVVSGSSVPELDAMLSRGFGATRIPVATSSDLGATWKELSPAVHSALVAPLSTGVAMFRGGHTLARAASMAGPWKDVRVVAEGEPAMTARSIVSVGSDVWIALDAGGTGRVVVVSGDVVRTLDTGSTSPIRSIVPTEGGVLLLGDAGTALLTHDGGTTFTRATHEATGNIAAGVRVGDAIYAVGGLPLSKKGPKGNVGFLLRSTDGGRTFTTIAADIVGRMWAIAKHGDQLFLAGTGKTAYRYAL